MTSILSRGAALIAALSLTMPFAPQAQAQTTGPATQTLTACLKRSSTPKDHVVMARWIFAVISHHPGVADLTAVKPEAYTATSREIGVLITRLISEDCAAETSAAIRADGEESMGVAFGTLGEAAMESLMGDPAVAQRLNEMVQYVDMNKLVKVMMDAQK